MVSSPVSLKEIAAVAGCSPRVAAAVLNPGNSNIRVGEATQQRILATASELGYRPNGLAQAMATGKSQVLGVLVEAELIEHRALMLSGAIEAAALHGYLLKVLSFRGLPTEVIRLSLDWRLAGLLALSLRSDQSEYLIDKTKEFNIPLAILDDTPSSYKGMSVSSDGMQGVRQAVEHLVNQGHRDIAFLGADAQSWVSEHRATYFRIVLQELGIVVREHWIAQSDWSDLDIITAAVKSLLESPRPTAIVCAGDPLALRVIAGARALRINVPEQLSVTGFANFDLSAFFDPPLTTIEQSFPEMGRVGVEKMISFLENRNNDGPVVQMKTQIPTQLVVRGSTAPPFQRQS